MVAPVTPAFQDEATSTGGTGGIGGTGGTRSSMKFGVGTSLANELGFSTGANIGLSPTPFNDGPFGTNYSGSIGPGGGGGGSNRSSNLMSNRFGNVV